MGRASSEGGGCVEDWEETAAHPNPWLHEEDKRVCNPYLAFQENSLGCFQATSQYRIQTASLTRYRLRQAARSEKGHPVR